MFLITGASGGIGNQLFKELAKENEVIGIANKKILKSFGKGISLNVDLLNAYIPTLLLILFHHHI